MGRKTKGLKDGNLELEKKKEKERNPNALAPIYEKIHNPEGKKNELDGKISKYNSILRSNTPSSIYKVLNKFIFKDD